MIAEWQIRLWFLTSLIFCKEETIQRIKLKEKCSILVLYKSILLYSCIFLIRKIFLLIKCNNLFRLYLSLKSMLHKKIIIITVSCNKMKLKDLNRFNILLYIVILVLPFSENHDWAKNYNWNKKDSDHSAHNNDRRGRRRPICKYNTSSFAHVRSTVAKTWWTWTVKSTECRVKGLERWLNMQSPDIRSPFSYI